MGGPKKIGVLGGTFDPPHWAHVRLAAHFASVFELDQLLLIPSGQPWQKNAEITSAEIRHQLTLAAAKALARVLCDTGIATRIAVDRMELDRPGPSYAIDTATEIRQRFGADACIIWLMGSDSLMHLDTWHDWQRLLEQVHLAVASRPGSPFHIDTSPLGQWIQGHQTPNAHDLENKPSGFIYLDRHLDIDLSSTLLRQRLKEKTPDRQGLLAEQIPPEVLAEVVNLGLYSQSR